MDILGLACTGAPVLSEQSRAALAQQGLSLSRGQLAIIDSARRGALAECERVEFAPGAIDELVLAFADSPFLNQADMSGVLAGAVELFYAVRDAAPIDVPDDEVLAAVRKSFDAAEGDVDAIDASSLACELTAQELQLACNAPVGGGEAADASGVYRIADDEGRVYCWSGDWEYDEFAPGWDGERWDDDLE